MIQLISEVQKVNSCGPNIMPGKSNSTNPFGMSVVRLYLSRRQVGTCQRRMLADANLSNCPSSAHLYHAVLDYPTFSPANISILRSKCSLSTLCVVPFHVYRFRMPVLLPPPPVSFCPSPYGITRTVFPLRGSSTHRP